jgi:hypothetical protein
VRPSPDDFPGGQRTKLQYTRYLTRNEGDSGKIGSEESGKGVGSGAGDKFYHMGGPVVNKELGLPPVSWWEGPDGSRLLTLYNNGYGSDPLPPEGWPYKTWIYINMTGDNQGPPDPETVKKDLEFYILTAVHFLTILAPARKTITAMPGATRKHLMNFSSLSPPGMPIPAKAGFRLIRGYEV